MTTNARVRAAVLLAGALGACTLGGAALVVAGSSDGRAAALVATPGSVGLVTVTEPDAGVVLGTDRVPGPGRCKARNARSETRWLPDRVCTPGAVSSRVTADNLATTICRPGGGYGQVAPLGVRPPKAAVDKVRGQLRAAYSVPDGMVVEIDHLVPLTLGGANDVRNLAPEPSHADAGSFVTNPKDAVEQALVRAVCRKTNPVPLAAAQAAIATDWRTALVRLGLARTAATTDTGGPGAEGDDGTS